MAAYGNVDAVRPGMLDGLEHDFVSKRAAVALSFGEPVMVDAGDETDVVLPDSTDASLVFQGVVVHTYYADNTVEGEYPAKHQVPVCRDGEIWVRVPDGLSGCANKPAYVIDLTSDGDYKKFTATSGANTYDCGCVFTSNPISLGTGENFAKIMVNGLK